MSLDYSNRKEGKEGGRSGTQKKQGNCMLPWLWKVGRVCRGTGAVENETTLPDHVYIKVRGLFFI